MLNVCYANTLGAQATEMREEEVEFNADFIVRMMPRIEFPALVQTATQVRAPLPCPIPPTRPLFALNIGSRPDSPARRSGSLADTSEPLPRG